MAGCGANWYFHEWIQCEGEEGHKGDHYITGIGTYGYPYKITWKDVDTRNLKKIADCTKTELEKPHCEINGTYVRFCETCKDFKNKTCLLKNNDNVSKEVVE